jgi:hypothetical protein
VDAILGANRNFRELLRKVLSEAKTELEWIPQVSTLTKPFKKSDQVIRDLAKLGLNIPILC